MVIHNNSCVEVTRGRFTYKGSDIDMTRLEFGMSFLQVKSSMTNGGSAICVNQRDIAHMRLEAAAGADNLHSLLAIFKREQLAIKAGGAVYVMRCAPVEVIPMKKHRHYMMAQRFL